MFISGQSERLSPVKSIVSVLAWLRLTVCVPSQSPQTDAGGNNCRVYTPLSRFSSYCPSGLVIEYDFSPDALIARAIHRGSGGSGAVGRQSPFVSRRSWPRSQLGDHLNEKKS